MLLDPPALFSTTVNRFAHFVIFFDWNYDITVRTGKRFIYFIEQLVLSPFFFFR